MVYEPVFGNALNSPELWIHSAARLGRKGRENCLRSNVGFAVAALPTRLGIDRRHQLRRHRPVRRSPGAGRQHRPHVNFNSSGDHRTRSCAPPKMILIAASENARRVASAHSRALPMPRPSTGFGNGSADNQISPSSQFAETIHRLAVGFGCDNLEATGAQQGSRCLKRWAVIIDHNDKPAGVSHHHLPRL